MVEVQEERARLLHAMLLALSMAAFGLLAGAVWLWTRSSVVALLVRNWQNLPATLDQLKQDRTCFGNNLT